MYGSAIRGISMARLHPGGLAGALERVLQGEAVHHRAEHADVVGLGGVHPRHGARAAAPEVAAADDDGDVDIHALRTAMISRAVASSVAASSPGLTGPARASPDGLKTIRFQRGDPVEATPASADLDLGEADDRAPPISWVIDCLSSLAYGWSSRATSLKKPLSRPSTIFGSACSGLPSLRVIVSSVCALVLDLVGRDVVAAEVLRAGEGDVDGDVVGQLAACRRPARRARR